MTKPGALLHPGTEHRLHWGGGCAKGLSYLGVPNMTEQNQAHSHYKSHSQKLEECRANPAPARKVKCMTQLSLLCSQARQDSGFQREFFLQNLFLLKGVLLCFFTPSHFPFYPCNRYALVARQVLLDLFMQEKENKAFLGCLSPLSLGG